MKRITNILIPLVFIAAIAASFWAGSCWEKEKLDDSRTQRCVRLLSFAIDKVENHKLSDDGVREALISNLYAAQEFCDDVALHAQLNDLWNTLIYRSETYIGHEDELAAQLRQIADTLLINN